MMFMSNEDVNYNIDEMLTLLHNSEVKTGTARVILNTECSFAPELYMQDFYKELTHFVDIGLLTVQKNVLIPIEGMTDNPFGWVYTPTDKCKELLKFRQL